MCWYCARMVKVRNLLDSHHSTAVRLRRAAILLACVYALGMLVLFLGVEACSALVHAGKIEVPTAINIGLVIGLVWLWFVVVKIPDISVPTWRKKSIAPSVLLCVLSVAPNCFIPFTQTVPTPPPRSVSFAI